MDQAIADDLTERRCSGQRWTSVIDQAYVDRIAIAPDGCAWLSGGVGIVRIRP